MKRPTSPSPALRRPVAGFTLLELMIAIAIAAILTGLAAPSMITVFRNNRVQTEQSSFVADLMLARTEAVRRGQPVSVCASTDGASCSSSSSWQTGWITFVDSNASCSASSPFKVRARFSGSDTMTPKTGSTSCVTFNRDGFTSNLGTAAVMFQLHTTPSVNAATRCVAIDLGGKLTSLAYGGTTMYGISCA